ncbi:MAG: hypothetical protein RIQ89_1886 [Bacteroidota bacterium]
MLFCCKYEWKIILLWMVIGLHATTGTATIERVSIQYGYDPIDATLFIQAALNGVADTVVIDDVGSEWMVEPLFITRNNLTIVLEHNVVLKAKLGYGPSDCLITADAKQNFNIIGYGATMQMQKSEYVLLNDSEYRHLIKLLACSNVLLSGLRLVDSGGDAIYLGASNQVSIDSSYCANIKIYNCELDNNYRQGISVISVDGLEISHCNIANTNGTLPEAGIDFEPNLPSQLLRNVYLHHCNITGNAGDGIKLYLGLANDDSLQLLFADNYISENQKSQVNITDNFFFDTLLCDGHISFERNFIANSTYEGIYISKSDLKINLLFEDCILHNTAMDTSLGYINAPIFFETIDYTQPNITHGGVEFLNCLIADSYNRSSMISYGSICNNLTGNLFIVNNFLPQLNLNGTSASILLSANTIPIYPATDLYITSADDYATENSLDVANPLLVRVGNNLSMPLPVLLSFSGTAQMFLDYPIQPLVRVIKANAQSHTDTLEANYDLIFEPTEDIIIAGLSTNYYSLQGVYTTCYILASPTNVVNATVPPIQIFPNPILAGESVKVQTREPILSCRLTASSGKIVWCAEYAPTLNTTIPAFSAGSYLLTVTTMAGSYTVRVMVIN